MSKYTRFVILSGMLLFMLLLSLAHPTAAYADDGAPPPPATEEPVGPATGGAVQPPTEEPSVEPPVAEDTTVAGILEAAPEGTEVILLNDEGDPEPLVTQEAIEIIQSGDPIWCPLGVTPQAGVGGCTDPGGEYENYDPTSLASLLVFLAENQPDQAGVIWIEANYDSSTNDPGSTDFTLDGATFSTMSQWDLTIQGGWSGGNNKNVNHNDPSVFNGATLNIENWSGMVTINDIQIVNTDATGLTVSTEGNINLEHVASNNNAGNGASLDTTGGIEVSQSNFNGNDGVGLTVVSIDPNMFPSAAAVDNTNTSSNTIKISGSNFNGNGESGLEILSSGNVMLSGVNANGNGGFGAMLMDLSPYMFFLNDSAISISGSHFDGNNNAASESVGLFVFFGGNVKLDNVSVSNNPNGNGSVIFALAGLDIQDSKFNENGYDGAFLVTLEDATITCSQFNGNVGVGMVGSSEYGIFTLNDVTFEGNGEGEYIYDGNGTPVILSGGCKIVNKGKDNKPSGLPLHIVPVSGGEEVGLNCSAFSGTELVLPNGDKVILHCPVLGTAVLTGQTLNQLPGQLGSEYGFLSAMNVLVSRDGEKTKTVSPALTVDFVIPEDQQGANLAILYWDGSQWFELPDCYVTANGYFQARTNYTGFFVLVSK